jgi:hypothetical protein
MNTAMIPQPRAEIKNSRFNGDYENLSEICTLIGNRGQMVFYPYCDIGGEHFTAKLYRRTAKCGDVYASIVFASNTDASKSRRMVIRPDGEKWLLLGDSMTAISSNNKYAKYADRLLREKAGN